MRVPRDDGGSLFVRRLRQLLSLFGAEPVDAWNRDGEHRVVDSSGVHAREDQVRIGELRPQWRAGACAVFDEVLAVTRDHPRRRRSPLECPR